MNKLHIHKITFRGSIDIEAWNKLLKFLYDNNIEYKTTSKISKTRDDAGLLIYFDSVIFQYKYYIDYYTNRKKLPIEKLIELIKKTKVSFSSLTNMNKYDILNIKRGKLK